MELLKKYFAIIFGCIISGAGIGLFLSPGKIAAGGASGIGILLYNLFSIPVSVTVLIVNALLVIVGYRYLDKSVIVKTVISTVFLSVFIEIFSMVSLGIDDSIISCAYGGALAGFGSGIVINSGSSTGGSDFGAVILHKFIPFISVPRIMLFIDLSIAIVSGGAFSDLSLMLYAISALFIASKSAEFVIEGVNFSKLLFVISDKNDEIAKYIINKINRGVTSFDAKGEFSGNGKKVLMCALSPIQFPKLKSYIHSKDKNAFIILTDARNVFGEGFNME